MTFVIQAENRADVLARVVLLFHRLTVEIIALSVVRRRESETMHIQVTIEASQDACQRIEAHLYKVVQVTSVKTERAAKNVLSETVHKKLGAQDE